MSFAANHSRFAFQIPALNETLRLVSFRYHGALSSAYECTVDIACERRDLPLQELLGKAGVLTLFDEQHPRHIHGEMVSLAQGGVGQRFASVGQERMNEILTAYHLDMAEKNPWYDENSNRLLSYYNDIVTS